MAVTSRDVAHLARVSQPTVSRALRDDSRVSEETKRRVREAAEKLGYVRSDTGRALSSGRTHRIGLLVTDLGNQFYMHIIGPIHQALEPRGYQLMLYAEQADNVRIPERMLAAGPDGVILATTTVDSETPVRLRERGVPLVYFNRVGPLVKADAVTVDPGVGYDEAVAQAVALGHRRIGAVLGPVSTSTAQTREIALRRALSAYGLPLDPELVRHGPYDTETGEVETRALLDRPDRPSLIFCGNDVVAFGALNAARRLGLAVPADVSIVGFDDLPTARWPIIELSTVAYDLKGMAEAVAEMIVWRIENPGAEYRGVEFPTAFLQRSTLGPLSG